MFKIALNFIKYNIYLKFKEKKTINEKVISICNVRYKVNIKRFPTNAITKNKIKNCRERSNLIEADRLFFPFEP